MTTAKTAPAAISRELIDTMMEICGYNARYDHLLSMSKLGTAWYHEYTCTPEEAERFKNFAIPFIQMNLKHLSYKRAEEEYAWFWLKFGLREVGT